MGVDVEFANIRILAFWNHGEGAFVASCPAGEGYEQRRFGYYSSGLTSFEPLDERRHCQAGEIVNVELILITGEALSDRGLEFSVVQSCATDYNYMLGRRQQTQSRI